MSQISLQHIDKSYQKNNQVIKDLNLEIFSDEFLVLVGPSGSGKTTTLRMIAGLEELSAGHLYLNDRLQNDEDPSTRHLSYVFQNYALLPHLTVYENIAFGLLNKKMTNLDKKRQVEIIAKKLSLFDKLGSYPNQLSGGQRQRVALARALVDEEKLILFDEPLSNLDALLRSEMRSELQLLQKAFQTTCIYVTHDQIEAMAMASRIVLMMDGRIVSVGTPYQMYHDPANVETILFMGHPETNLIKIEMINQDVITHQLIINVSVETYDLLIQAKLHKAYLAVRPQDIIVSHTYRQGLIKGVLVATENLGMKKLLHIEAINQTFRAIVDVDFIEDEELYIDFSGHSYLFNEHKKRVRKDEIKTIIFNKDYQTSEFLQVKRELINYGYEVKIDQEKAHIICDTKNNSFKLKLNNKEIQLKKLTDIFNELSYIK
jgi:multiple sugar transport system ATP-binding protein